MEAQDGDFFAALRSWGADRASEAAQLRKRVTDPNFTEPPKSSERNRAEAMNRLVGRVASLEAAVETLEGSMGTSVGGTTQTCQQLFRVARVLHEKNEQALERLEFELAARGYDTSSNPAIPPFPSQAPNVAAATGNTPRNTEQRSPCEHKSGDAGRSAKENVPQKSNADGCSHRWSAAALHKESVSSSPGASPSSATPPKPQTPRLGHRPVLASASRGGRRRLQLPSPDPLQPSSSTSSSPASPGLPPATSVCTRLRDRKAATGAAVVARTLASSAAAAATPGGAAGGREDADSDDDSNPPTPTFDGLSVGPPGGRDPTTSPAATDATSYGAPLLATPLWEPRATPQATPQATFQAPPFCATPLATTPREPSLNLDDGPPTHHGAYSSKGDESGAPLSGPRPAAAAATPGPWRRKGTPCARPPAASISHTDLADSAAAAATTPAAPEPPSATPAAACGGNADIWSPSSSPPMVVLQCTAPAGVGPPPAPASAEHSAAHGADEGRAGARGFAEKGEDSGGGPVASSPPAAAAADASFGTPGTPEEPEDLTVDMAIVLTSSALRGGGGGPEDDDGANELAAAGGGARGLAGAAAAMRPLRRCRTTPHRSAKGAMSAAAAAIAAAADEGGDDEADGGGGGGQGGATVQTEVQAASPSAWRGGPGGAGGGGGGPFSAAEPAGRRTGGALAVPYLSSSSASSPPPPAGPHKSPGSSSELRSPATPQAPAVATAVSEPAAAWAAATEAPAANETPPARGGGGETAATTTTPGGRRLTRSMTKAARSTGKEGSTAAFPPPAPLSFDDVSPTRAACTPKAPAVAAITEEEFAAAPQYLRYQVTLAQLNDGVAALNALLLASLRSQGPPPPLPRGATTTGPSRLPPPGLQGSTALSLAETDVVRALQEATGQGGNAGVAHAKNDSTAKTVLLCLHKLKRLQIERANGLVYLDSQ